jgi:hypothetical protein
MLLDRTRPNEQQGFGDYLSDLGKKNGFSDIKRFKLFLFNSSKKRYYVYCSYSRLVRIISGLFIELGIDQTEDAGVERPQCFRCLNTEPKSWVWDTPEEWRCQQMLDFSDLFKSPREKFRTNREDFCGLMRCSAKKLGLDFSPVKEGLYYADILSKEERDEDGVPRIYADHKAFTLI